MITHSSVHEAPLGRIVSLRLYEDAGFPNNASLPVLLYHQAFDLKDVDDPGALIERVFACHGWSNGWRSGIYDFHHYHSTAHEVLGCYAGKARVQLGGPSGPTLEFQRGDVLVIPAGVAHKNVEAGRSFRVVGAYANGADYDMNSGREGERPLADERIAQLPRPEADPVHGPSGPLLQHWRG
ncbi:MAG TPA: cupin domain-containing protein [Polyangiaceae bacterium]|nr:cupin domain-containing protein [Polyangiaceae bacterium]